MKEKEYLVLILQFYKEEEQWIGDCESLGVMSYGDSIDESRKSLESLISLTLNEWVAAGMRDRMFAERGIVTDTEEWRSQDLTLPTLVPNHLMELHLQPMAGP